MNADSLISPVVNQNADIELAKTLLDQIISKAPPLLAEGLYLAAISHTFSVESLRILRARNDDKEERLVERLLQFSFVWEREDKRAGEPIRYSMQALERDLLLRKLIEKDAELFVTAHRRALEFRKANPNPDRFVQAQSQLYHLLLVDTGAGIDHLMQTFRAYNAERLLAAADRLLVTAGEVRPYLELLKSPELGQLDDTVAHLQARLLQLRGNWNPSLEALRVLCNKPDLTPKLAPYVARGYGYSLAHAGMYVEAIEQYQFALEEFSKRVGSDYEKALTMIHIGDAYLNLALATRGQREVTHLVKFSWPQFFADLGSLVVWLPLIIYMSFGFGARVWLPSSWPMLRGLDWIVARLFASSARWYRRAAPLLARSNASADKRQAEEKLAGLALAMGDLTVAVPAFKSLLTEETLGEYNRARAQAGLGQSMLRLGKPETAIEYFEQALPVLEAYADMEMHTQVLGLYAQANFARGKHTDAIKQYSKALNRYQQQKDLVGLTEVAERLKDFERDEALGSEARTLASSTMPRMSLTREYLLHFKHPYLVAFRLVSLIVLFLFIIAVPLLTLHLQNEAALQANTVFHPVPVLLSLLSNDVNYAPTFAQHFSSSVEANFKPQLAVNLGFFVFGIYLVTYTLIGLFVIARTQLGALQYIARSRKVRVDLQTLTLGEGVSAIAIDWKNVRRVIYADVFTGKVLRPDSSSMVVVTDTEAITIDGNLAWYEHLRDRVKDSFATNTNVKKEDVGVRILPSKMFWLYVASLLCIVGFIMVAFVLGTKDFLYAPLFGTTYSLATFYASDSIYVPLVGPYALADLYPFFYLGIFIPPVWWGITQPIRMRIRTAPHSPLIPLVFVLGIVLAILYSLTTKPWLVTPDYLVPLFIIWSLVSTLYGFWRARDLITGELVYPFPIRAIASVIVILVMAYAVSAMASELLGHHYTVVGNKARSDASFRSSGGVFVQTPTFDRTVYYQQSVEAYNLALSYVPTHHLALNNRAASYVTLGDYEKAVADYDLLLFTSNTQYEQLGSLYANRAVAKESWAAKLTTTSNTAAILKTRDAIADLSRALAYTPETNYYLWRGVAYHTANDFEQALLDYDQVLRKEPKNIQALAAKGWVYFIQANDESRKADVVPSQTEADKLRAKAKTDFQESLNNFQAAVLNTPPNDVVALSDNYLAVGYAHFRLGNYDETLKAWQKSVELKPEDPVGLISRASVYYKLAYINNGGCGGNRSAAVQDNTVSYLKRAIDDLNSALKYAPADHFTYRTRAQLEFALAACPGFDPKQQYTKAISTYDETIKIDPTNDFYLQYRARIRFSLGQILFNEGDETQARAILNKAIEDIRAAYNIDPNGPGIQTETRTRVWKDLLENEAWGRYYNSRANSSYTRKQYREALTDYETAAKNWAAPAVAFRAGLASLAVGDNRDRTLTWYREGVVRLKTMTEKDRLTLLATARKDVTDLIAERGEARALSDAVLEILK